jgi:hypothetical protein
MGNLNIEGDLTGIGRCPHCQVANPQMKQLWQTPHPVHPKDSPNVGHVWAVYQCTTCSQMTLVKCKPSIRADIRKNWPALNLQVADIFPTHAAVQAEIPGPANRYLVQAHETLQSPDASAVMSASAIDAMLKDKGFGKGSLYERIDAAVTAHVLTEGMGKWAHAVRLEANNVRHADASNPHLTQPQAKQVLEFATALGDFIYVLTAKIEKGAENAAPKRIVKP